MAEERGGFLGRWARRKTQTLQGKAPGDLVAAGKPAVAAVPPQPEGPAPAAAAALPAPADGATLEALDQQPPSKKPLSVADAHLLTPESDFKPFMAGGVGPDVRNAAMKKLFADPHFNVMDGLDTYIDDYSRSDPIPESMLRQMVSARFLKLFDDEEDPDNPAEARQTEPEQGAQEVQEAATLLRENANNPTDKTVAQSDDTPDNAGPGTDRPDNSRQPESLPDRGASPQDHADTDLRLQPDHAAPAPGAGRGTS